MDDQFNQFGQQPGYDPNMGQPQFDPNAQFQQQYDQAQQFGQQQYDQAQQFGQQQYDQAQQFGQQGFDPNAGMQQMQYQSDSEPSFNPNIASPMGQAPMPPAPAPEKKSKKGLIIGLSIAGVLLVAAALLIFVFDVFHIFKKDKGNDSAEAVVKQFIQAIGDADADKLMECVPKEAMGALSEYGTSKEEIQQALSLMKGFGLKVDGNVTSEEDMSVDEVKAAAPSASSLNISAGKRVKATVNMKMSLMGEEQNQTNDVTFICAKIDGKWYIVNSDASEDDFIDTEATTETPLTPPDTQATSEDNTQATTEASKPGVDNAPSKVVTPPAGLSDSLWDTQISFDGHVLTLPCSLADLGDKWKLEDELSEKDKTLQPKDTSDSYSLTADGIDEWFYGYVSFVNDKTTVSGATDGKIYYMDLDIDYVEDPTKVPEVILPKGITWGSNSSDIKKAYGEPSYLSDEEGYDKIYMYYYDDSYDREFDFTLDRETGLEEIRVYNYTIQYN